jgi:hypothetical protein
LALNESASTRCRTIRDSNIKGKENICRSSSILRSRVTRKSTS